MAALDYRGRMVQPDNRGLQLGQPPIGGIRIAPSRVEMLIRNTRRIAGSALALLVVWSQMLTEPAATRAGRHAEAHANEPRSAADRGALPNAARLASTAEATAGA